MRSVKQQAVFVGSAQNGGEPMIIGGRGSAQQT
jgi:hypothetical protein